FRQSSANHPDLHSFPTRRSSDLSKNQQWSAQIKGDLQTHSVWSDGSGSIQEMAEAAAERGYKYLAITDHSKGLKIAGGIDEQQRSEEHTSELQSRGHLVCRLLLE